jgi:hypothetical protein
METRVHALETCEPSCIPRLARHFFIPDARGTLRVMEHVAVLEPFRVGRQGLEPRGTWQRRNPPE